MDGSVPVEHRSQTKDQRKEQRYANTNSYGIVGSTTSSRAKSFGLKIFTVIVFLLALYGWAGGREERERERKRLSSA